VSCRTRSISACLLSVPSERPLAGSQLVGRVCPTILNRPLFSARLTRKLRPSRQSCHAVCPQVGIALPLELSLGTPRALGPLGWEEFSSATYLSQGQPALVGWRALSFQLSMAYRLLFLTFFFVFFVVVHRSFLCLSSSFCE
jgi:hypothetical protein